MANEQTLGDAPVEPEYHEKMNRLAYTVDKFFNGDTLEKRTGFVLLVFPFEGREGRCNYISNANRDDVIVLLKEQLARFQGMPESKGGRA